MGLLSLSVVEKVLMIDLGAEVEAIIEFVGATVI